MAKFNKKSIALYGVLQIAEGNKAIKSAAETTGTITTSLAADTITGVGTAFLTELTPNGYLYDNTGAIVGQVLAVASDTAATMVDNGLVAISGATFATGLGPKNAIAALNMNFSTERTSEAFQYVGDELNRDEETVVTDKFAKFDFEAFVPKLGTIAGADPVISEVPMNDWLQAAGLGIVLSTGSGGYATATNSIVSNEFLTVEVRRASSDIATDKTYNMSDCRGALDLDAMVGTKGKLKYNFTGNIDNVVQKTKIVADYQNQKTNTAGALKSSTTTLSEIVLYTSESTPAIVGTSNICFEKLTASNVAGFDYVRFLTSCLDGWSKEAVPSDVTITIIEDAADATYNPDDHVEDDHLLVVRYGLVTGDKVELLFSKLTLADVPNTEVASYAGQDLSFRNVGTFSMKLY